jgi:predicted nuclease of predicted toxin-antitoxin system
VRLRFLADADFNHKIVAGLRRREQGLDCLGAHEAAVIGLPDPEVLAIAANTNRVLLSHDRKTMIGHFRNRVEATGSPGLIIVPQSMDIGRAIQEILLIWGTTEADEWRDRVGYLPL